VSSSSSSRRRRRSTEHGFIVVDRIRAALSQTSFSDTLGHSDTGNLLRLTASFGVAGLPTDTMNADILREAAEAALGHARSTGDRVIMFESPMLQRR
jgi:GGDEF domain-containing protein